MCVLFAVQQRYSIIPREQGQARSCSNNTASSPTSTLESLVTTSSQFVYKNRAGILFNLISRFDSFFVFTFVFTFVTHSVKMSHMSPNAILSYGQFNVENENGYQVRFYADSYFE